MAGHPEKSPQVSPMERLRFSTTVLRLLGEELNPSPDQGILELIKNAYDADATRCTVELKGVHLEGGSIRVWDDGNGMTAEEIRNGWLIVGDSLKSRTAESPGGRPLVGSKGLGRLGALRLGHLVTLTTRPKKEPGIQYRVVVDWQAFDSANVVEEVDIPVVKEAVPKGERHGTEVLIEVLPSVWQKGDISRLARAILLLRDPFDADQSFQAVLMAKEFTEIERLARSGLFSECDFHVVAKVDDEGRASAEVKSAGGKLLFSANHANIAGEKGPSIYTTPAASFELWEYNVSPKGFAVSTKYTTLGALKDWLEQFGGVRLYHRGVRVLPYGEPKNDWLDMNLRRSQRQELSPSTNNSVGCVRIADPSRIFQLKTDRLGFFESEPFDELRRFAGDVLDWMWGMRVQERERRKRAQIEQSQQQEQEAEKSVSTALEKLPPAEREVVEGALQKLKAAHQAKMNLKDETALLYFTLGTVGTTAAAFAHQTKQPIIYIVQDANLLDDWLGDPDRWTLFREECSQAVKRVHREAGAIYSFANVTLKLLEHEKRLASAHRIHQLIDETIELLKPYCDAREAVVERDYVKGEPKIWCAKAAFEAILTNLLTNSLQAFLRCTSDWKAKGGRRILIQTRVSEQMITLRVLDNGPGIDKLSVDEIWLPGKTTTERGTGLGLAIVKDVVEDLRGRVAAEAHGELGGAVFTITLPLKG